MTNIAEFIHDSKTSRIDVTIGSHIVCKIRPVGRKVHTIHMLPDLEARRITDSVDKAKALALQILADWFRGLGPAGASCAVLLDMQAEIQRRSAAA